VQAAVDSVRGVYCIVFLEFVCSFELFQHRGGRTFLKGRVRRGYFSPLLLLGGARCYAGADQVVGSRSHYGVSFLDALLFYIGIVPDGVWEAQAVDSIEISGLPNVSSAKRLGTYF